MKQLLVFTSPWCGPCKQLKPLIEELKNEINIVEFNVENDGGVSTTHDVRSVPTLILMDNGVEKGRRIGIQNKQVILDFYNQ